MSVAAVMFWAAPAAMGYVFVGYPLLLGSVVRRRPVLPAPTVPTVSLIVSAYRKIIGEKLANCLALDYPREKLDILVISDASTDSCNGLKSKSIRTAINENWGPHYLHLSMSPGLDYLHLRLQSMARDCNERLLEPHYLQLNNIAVLSLLIGGETHAYPESALQVLLSHITPDLDTRASHHAGNHPIETPELSHPPCALRVYPKKTEECEGQARPVCRMVLVQSHLMWSHHRRLQSEVDECSLRGR